MPVLVRTETRKCAAGLDGTVFVLETDTSRAVVWPALGFNCLSWQIKHGDEWRELLWSDPLVFENPQPTRSGIPILFPFPNRIRDGRFTWNGRTYHLPINDPQQKNAIHGFVCYRPWKVGVASGPPGSPEGCACIGCIFRGSQDAPECVGRWPADYVITVTYYLFPSRLQMNIGIENPDSVPLPFGVGLHPYFRFSADRSRFQLSQTAEQWELEDCLPTGKRLPLVGRHRRLTASAIPPDLSQTLHWDDAYRVQADEQAEAKIQGENGNVLRIQCSPSFRDWVVFTPPHREAVCLEPYTCVTDAINLQQKGIDAGLITLPPGQHWEGRISMDSRTDEN